MTREQIEQGLRTYREKTARLAVLQTRAVEIEHEILELRDRLDDPSGVGAVVLDGMPRAHTVGSIVERQVIRCDRDTDEIRALQHELDRVQTEAFCVGQRVAEVEAWLSALDERERALVEAHYLDGLPWDMACAKYQQRYQAQISRSWAKHLRNQALEKMERVSG